MEDVNLSSYEVIDAGENASIEIGKRADIIIADDNFNIIMAILNGEIIYKGE